MKVLINFLLGMILITLLQGCAASSPEEFRTEGEGLVRALTCELGEVQTREELLLKVPLLQRYFNEIADTMIAAQDKQVLHLPEIRALPSIDHALNQRLCSELSRCFKIEGGRDIIQSAQKEALAKLRNHYERRCRIQKGKERIQQKSDDVVRGGHGG